MAGQNLKERSPTASKMKDGTKEAVPQENDG